MIEYVEMMFLKKAFSTTFEFEKDINNKLLRTFIFVFTELGSSFGAAIIITVIAFVSGYKTLLIFVPIYSVQLGITELIKFILKSPRPKTIIKNNLWGMKLTSGAFPSGHSSNIFTLAMLISFYYRVNTSLAILIFSIAGAVSLSRIFLGKHYVIDVIAGALLGIIISILGAFYIEVLLLKII